MSFFRNLLLTGLLALASSLSHAQQMMQADDFALENYKGKVVYVDFWASWCSPCRASFPFMAELANDHTDDLAIVAINVDERREDADEFLKDFEVPFDIVFDHAGKLGEQYKVPGMPTSYLFDRQGNLLGQHTSFRKKDVEAIRQWVEEAIAN